MNAKASATKVCPGCSARYPPDAIFCPNDGSPLTADNLVDFEAALGSGHGGATEAVDTYLGREISGHIEIRSVAGVGAMGRVYRAFQKGIERDVAVKVLHRELSANQQLVARFHREAKVASRLQHPNVVQVHLAGQLPDGAMYIVMEYLDGQSLQTALVATGAPFPLHRALHIALQICDAAGEAHSKGVVHRDIKPENVMLVERGGDPDFVKVLDFGIARLNWGEQSMATAAGLIFGTARYISPEGAQGEAVGPEGDVYATATLLYQMLAGRTPFEGDQAVALLIQQIHDAPPPLRSIPAAANVPEALAAVIMQNLSKLPGERASDARTFGRALVEAAKGAGFVAEDLVPRSSLFVPHARLSDPGPPPQGTVPPPQPRGEDRPRDSYIPEVTLGGVVQATVPGASQKTQMWTPPPTGGSAVTTAPGEPLLEATTAPVPPALPAIVSNATVPLAARETTAALPAYASSVDRTLDETSDVRAPVDDGRVRTEPAMPLAIGSVTPSPAVIEPSAQVAAVSPSSPASPPTPSPPVVLPPPPLMHPMGLTALVEEEEAVPPRRVFGVIVLCLIIGILGAATVLYQLGMVGAAPRTGSLDEVVLHADEALRHARWDSPPGDNVRDITTDGLTKWPKNSRLLEVRERATDELVKQAVGRNYAGDYPAALHMARLAKELDPTDTTAQHLVDELERSAAAKKLADAAITTPTVVTTVTPPTRNPTHPPVATSGRVALETSVAHPRVGQLITFTSKVAGSSKTIDDPRFLINGPGLGDKRLNTVPGGAGTFTTTFVGFEPGKYEVDFYAKVDGAMLRATRTVVIEGDGPLPPVPGTPSSSQSLPSSVPSGKWL